MLRNFFSLSFLYRQTTLSSKSLTSTLTWNMLRTTCWPTPTSSWKATSTGAGIFLSHFKNFSKNLFCHSSTNVNSEISKILELLLCQPFPEIVIVSWLQKNKPFWWQFPDLAHYLHCEWNLFDWSCGPILPFQVPDPQDQVWDRSQQQEKSSAEKLQD